MGVFRKREPGIAMEIFRLLISDKVEQMITFDTVISLLIQKGVFTKEEFYEVKQRVNNTTQYQKIKQTLEDLVESLDSKSLNESLTDEELNEILDCIKKENTENE